MSAQIALVSSGENILVELDLSDVCSYENNQIKLTNSGMDKIKQIDFSIFNDCYLSLINPNYNLKVSIFHENQSIAKFCPYIEYSVDEGIVREMKIKIHSPTSKNNAIHCDSSIDSIRKYFENPK